MRASGHLALAALALCPWPRCAMTAPRRPQRRADPVLAAVVAGDWRGEEAKARDALPPPGRVAHVLGPASPA